MGRLQCQLSAYITTCQYGFQRGGAGAGGGEAGTSTEVKQREQRCLLFGTPSVCALLGVGGKLIGERRVAYGGICLEELRKITYRTEARNLTATLTDSAPRC